MVRKRASLKDKGEEILGMKRGGKGADILFGTEGEAEPLSAEEGMPQGEADLDEALGAEAEAAEVDETGTTMAEYPAVEEGMPQGEADIDEELDLASVLGAEAEAAESEAALPELATTPAASAPPSPPEPTTSPPTVERPAPTPLPATPALMGPQAAPPPGVERPAPTPPPSSMGAATPPAVAQPAVTPATSTAAATPPPAAARPASTSRPSVPAAVVAPSVAASTPPPTPAVAPPSTTTGAPDLSVPRPPRYIEMVSGDFDLLEQALPAEAAAATGPPEAVELTEEEEAELLRRRAVKEDLAGLDKAIDAQYERILRDNVSVNKWITDWCHNLLAEARNIVLYRQMEHLARAEWNVQQVRARLDRAEESRKQANRYAWPIAIWGVIWFVIFVYLIFEPTALLRYFTMAEGSESFLIPEIFLLALFFGGIGGVAAVFYHLFKYVQERSFDNQFILSYVAKPFMGMILGSMIYLTLFVLLRALQILPAGLEAGGIETVNDVMYVALLYFVALAAGFKENLAFDLLNRAIRAVLGRGNEEEEQLAEPPPAAPEPNA
jgi:hypothetical protein